MVPNAFVLITKCICPNESGVANLSFLACVAGQGGAGYIGKQACVIMCPHLGILHLQLPSSDNQ